MSASAPEMKKGPFSGMNVIGDVTEAIQSFLTDRWNEAGDPPRFEEDLSLTLPPSRTPFLRLSTVPPLRRQVIHQDEHIDLFQVLQRWVFLV